jgi:pre-mRNA-splicing factor CWC26
VGKKKKHIKRPSKSKIKRGNDSNVDGVNGDVANKYEKRRPHDSSSDSGGESERKAKMSSGHKAGLQKSEDFTIAERNIREKKREEMRKFNATGGRSNDQTTYRDASGKKRNVSLMEDADSLRRQEEEKAEKQRLANKGTAQRRQEETRLRELEEASNMTLARGVEDTKLEEMKRSVVRKGDPMALHALKRQQEEEVTMNGVVTMTHPHRRPVYKGPQPKSNRYGLRPGYRWDGIDRGNGFEDRVLEALHSKGRKKEEAYRWSAADM